MAFFNKNNFITTLTDSDFVLRYGVDNYIEFYVVDTVGRVPIDVVEVKIVQAVVSGRDAVETVILDYALTTEESDGIYSITLEAADAILESEANVEFLVKITYDTSIVAIEKVVGTKTSKV